jgi:hypothetical protein
MTERCRKQSLKDSSLDFSKKPFENRALTNSKENNQLIQGNVSAKNSKRIKVKLSHSQEILEFPKKAISKSIWEELRRGSLVIISKIIQKNRETIYILVKTGDLLSERRSNY